MKADSDTIDRMPTRIRLQRTRGWRKPEGAVVVSRPSRWANPFRIGVDGEREDCLSLYQQALMNGALAFTVEDVQRELAGRDLACWCRPNERCHADVLMELANDGGAPSAGAERGVAAPNPRQSA